MSTRSIASLHGRVAMVTGASSGLGRAISIAYAAAGARVICADLAPYPVSTAVIPRTGKDPEKVIPTHELLNSRSVEVEADGPVAMYVEINMTSAESIETAIAKGVANFGRLDILVNNAGVLMEAKYDPVFPRIHETPEAVWDADMSVNGKGVWLGCKYATAQFLRQEPSSGGDRGWIINMCSITGVVGFPGTSSYTASKGAVMQMTKAIALEYAADRIHVNCICPSFTHTSLLDPVKQAQGADETTKTLSALHPWGRMGESEDVAKVAVFLAGDGASWCTGAPFIVDGGYLAK